MQKIYIFAYVLLFATLSTLPTQAQQRTVNWVHGLNDDADCWGAYLNPNTGLVSQFPNMVPKAMTYSTKTGIVTAATELTNSGSIDDDAQSIAVCHSMGGLVMRELMRDPNTYRGKVGGLVTFTSPHAGAPIGTSVFDKAEANFLRYAVTSLVSPWAVASLPLAFPHSIIEPLITTGILVALVATNTLDNVIQLAQSATTASSLSDFIYNGVLGGADIGREGSTFLATTNPEIIRLNAAQPSSELLSVAITGEEHQPVLWRIAGCMGKKLTTDPRQVPMDQFEGIDESILKKVMIAQAVYVGSSIIFAAVAAATASNGSFGTAVWAGLSSALFARGAYALTNRGINLKWQAVIGATTTQNAGYNLTYPRLTNICTTQRWRPRCWRLSTITQFVGFVIHTPQPSDGLVPATSQTALPGKLPFGDLPENKIVGANHLEVLNHIQTTQHLKEIFDAARPNEGPHPFFKIP